jgi:hypothetical protein
MIVREVMLLQSHDPLMKIYLEEEPETPDGVETLTAEPEAVLIVPDDLLI